MEPSEYYYNRFKDDFRIFWKSLDINGSCSRIRAHIRQEFWGDDVHSTVGTFYDNKADYFSCGDFINKPSNTLPDHLADIPEEDWPDFLIAMFYMILFDQAMYTHCKEDYVSFQKLTGHPKMDGTIGWYRSLMMANPYEIFSDEVLRTRELNIENLIPKFTKWAEFIVINIRKYFECNHFDTYDWKCIRRLVNKIPA